MDGWKTATEEERVPEEAVRLLKKLLAIPSVNGRDDEGKAAEFLCDYLKGAGIPARVQRLDERHANVVAVLEGGDSEHPLIWNGHLDTVPYGNLEEWHMDPAVPEEKDGFLYGRGASDMKSGLAAMVYALCTVSRSGRRPARTVRFLGTCDEEKGGLGARAILRDGLMIPGAELLVGEPTGCRLGVAQKGCLWLEIQAAGKTSHGAYPEQGINAVEQAVALAMELKAYVERFSHPILGVSTVQITEISGGIAPNMTPDACRLLLDIRMTPGLTGAMVTEQARKLEEIRRRAAAGRFQAEFRIQNERRAIEISDSHPMTRSLREAMQAAGLSIEQTGINYFTDASILVGEDPEAAVLLFGPGEPDLAHKPDERVSLELYGKAIEILTRFLQPEVKL